MDKMMHEGSVVVTTIYDAGWVMRQCWIHTNALDNKLATIYKTTDNANKWFCSSWDIRFLLTFPSSESSMIKNGRVLNFRETNTRVLAVGTPPPVTATLSFLSADNEPLEKASIGDAIQMVVTSEQAGPHNMMLTECTATRVGGEGDAVPFTIIENGLEQHLFLLKYKITTSMNNHFANLQIQLIGTMRTLH